jgi:hypothetical protein
MTRVQNSWKFDNVRARVSFVSPFPSRTSGLACRVEVGKRNRGSIEWQCGQETGLRLMPH